MKQPSAATYLSRALAILGLGLVAACPRSVTDAGFVVTLSPPSASLYVDDTAHFTATLRDPDGNVVPTTFTWTIDDAGVATVDGGGVVHGRARGFALLRVSARGAVAAAPISVAADNQTLSVDPPSANVFVDGSQRFTATLRDRNGDIVPSTPAWTSTDPSVATVDGSGTARGKASGSATIQARVGDLVAGGTLTVSPRGTSAVFVGAGDIASCTSGGDEATATLLDGISGTVFALGDNAYPSGTTSNYNDCYAPSWGRHKARTRPVPGNHEYETYAAAPYFGYFGTAAGDPATGYYSYDVGPWHIIALNSNLRAETGSPQEQWLRADLEANPVKCTLAYWHHPRFSSGPHGSMAAMQPLWQALYEAGADVVLTGHDHTYERFAPQAPDGTVDLSRGLREFVVGTGGASLYAWSTLAPNSEVRNNTTRGVLKLTLYADRYEWKFVPVAGKTFTDTGSASCH